MRLWSIPGGPAHCVEWAFPRTATSPWNRSGGASFPTGFMRIESAVTVGWALTYNPPCPLRLNPGPGSKRQIFFLPMTHSHPRGGHLFAGDRGPNALKFPSRDMNWHTLLRKSIVRLGHNPPSERRRTPFSQLRRYPSAGRLRWWTPDFFYSATEECWRCSGRWEAALGSINSMPWSLLPRWYCFTRNTSRCSQSSAVARRG